MQVVSRRRSEVRVPWLHSLTATQEEDSETEESKLSEVRGECQPRGPPEGVRSRGTG